MTRPKQDRIPILERTDARGRLLYRRTGGGNIARNYKVRQAGDVTCGSRWTTNSTRT